MIKKYSDIGTGFFPTVISDTWQLCYVNPCEQYGELKVLKKHNDTDEVFVLLKGKAWLYTYENECVAAISMTPHVFYNIEKGTWHHLKINEGSLLIAAENKNVSSDNSERMVINNA